MSTQTSPFAIPMRAKQKKFVILNDGLTLIKIAYAVQRLRKKGDAHAL